MIKPRSHLGELHRFVDEHDVREDYLRLDLNEVVPHIDVTDYTNIISSFSPWLVSAYTETTDLYDILAKRLNVTPEHLIITQGSDAGIKQVLEVFCDPRDHIIITYPNYGMYIVYSKLLNLTSSFVQYDTDFTLSIEKIIRLITSSTKIIVVADPNGALGSVIPPNDLEYLIRTASGTGSVVLLDETYMEFYQDNWSGRIDEFDNLVIVRSFSKAAGLAGLRIGYILTNPNIHEWLIKANPFMQTNSFAVEASKYILNNYSVVTKYVESVSDGRRYLVKELTRLGFDFYAGKTNFILVKFAALRDTILAQLISDRILVMDLRSKSLLSEYTRITLGPVDYMYKLILSIETALKGTT